MGKESRTGVRKIKGISVTVFLILVLVIPGFAGIRGTEWRMSKAQVKAVEGRPKAKKEDRLIYEDRVGGLKTDVIYLFNHRGELYSIEYHFHMNERERSFLNRALKQFDKISRILHAKYGPPVSGKVYSEKEKKIGRIVLKRPIVEGWQKDEVTYVYHTLKDENVYKHGLVYGHRELTDEYAEFCKQKEAEKF